MCRTTARGDQSQAGSGHVESISIVLLLAVVISGLLISFSPVPLPILQIGLGALLADGSDLGVVLPPLLFLCGWRIPKPGFFRAGSTILALAFRPVVFTALGRFRPPTCDVIHPSTPNTIASSWPVAANATVFPPAGRHGVLVLC